MKYIIKTQIIQENPYDVFVKTSPIAEGWRIQLCLKQKDAIKFSLKDARINRFLCKLYFSHMHFTIISYKKPSFWNIFKR